jgi:hypothetical protein
MSARNRPDASIADLSSARPVDEDSPAGRTSCSRRSLLLASASALSLSLMSNVGRAQEAPPVRLPSYSPQDLSVIEIDDELRSALGDLRTFAGGRSRGGAMFLAILSVDCVWCRYQYAANRKILHAVNVRYALTYFEPKFASLLDPALLGGWQSDDSNLVLSVKDSVAQKIFLGITEVDPDRHSAAAKKLIQDQAKAVSLVMNLLDARFAPRGISVKRFPTTILIHRRMDRLTLISRGFEPRFYYPYISRPTGDALRQAGLRELKSFLMGEPSYIDNAQGRLSPAAWDELGKLFAVEQGNKPFGDPTAAGPGQVFVLFDPSDVHARELWHRLSVMEFYASMRWIPVPDMEDDQSLASWQYLFRHASKTDGMARIHFDPYFIAVMLGYSPDDKRVDPSADEVDRMLRTRVVVDRLYLVTQRLPVVILRTPSGEIQWQTNPSATQLLTALGLLT